ncbi:MAG: prepilin-type N-terminal cleavage/methylation domain-containing protein [Nitrospirae bacterium]|nr:prepilin-type N-terminal cleavage/methylation domain-containing protein [Nitrospirota bacterium]
MNKLRNKRGFTLIEMMIVGAIIGVLAGIAGTTWYLGLNHSSLTTGARDIATALRKAKQLAVTTNTTEQVNFDLDNETFQLVGAGPATDLKSVSSGHKPINISSFEGVTTGTPWIQFANNGTATFSTGGTTVAIILARTDNNSETRTINVNSMGRIQVP